MFEMGADILVDLLPSLGSSAVQATPQDCLGASLTRLYKKEDGEVDWEQPAIQIERMIRAFDPWPGCYTSWGEKTLKLISADTKTGEIASLPGSIVDLEEEGRRSVCVATGSGILQLRRVQLEGRRPQDIEEFCRGYPQFLGGVLASRN
jgi:methionyl-tRNA formyltransferase